MNKDRKYNPIVHVFAGGAAGAVASAFTTPLDVVKTLLNTQETGVGLTKGMREAISQVEFYYLLLNVIVDVIARILITYQRFFPLILSSFFLCGFE